MDKKIYYVDSNEKTCKFILGKKSTRVHERKIGKDGTVKFVNKRWFVDADREKLVDVTGKDSETSTVTDTTPAKTKPKDVDLNGAVRSVLGKTPSMDVLYDFIESRGPIDLPMDNKTKAEFNDWLETA